MGTLKLPVFPTFDTSVAVMGPRAVLSCAALLALLPVLAFAQVPQDPEPEGFVEDPPDSVRSAADSQEAVPEEDPPSPTKAQPRPNGHDPALSNGRGAPGALLAPSKAKASAATPPKSSGPARGEPNPPQRVATESELRTEIESRAHYLRGGDVASADVELLQLIETRQQLGARNVVIASAALLREASRAFEAGRLDRAIDLAEKAAKISPDLVAAHCLRVKLYWRQNWSQIDRITGAVGELLAAKLTRIGNFVVFASNCLAILGIALLGTIVGFTLIQLFKYLRYASHDLVRILPNWFGAGEGAMMIAILIASPLVFGFGIAPSIVLALGAVFAYQTARESRVSVYALALLGAAPGLIWLAAPLVTFHGSVTDALETAASEAFAVDAEQRLEVYAQSTGRNDTQGAIVLARRSRMRGDLAGAELQYRRALAAEPQDSIARNNLGKTQYLLGHEEQAKLTFQQAARAGELAEPYLNLASLLLDAGDFDAANASIAKARLMNRELTEAYTRLDGNPPTAKKLFDAGLSEAPLWGRLLDVDAANRRNVSIEIWRIIGGATPVWGMPILVLVVLVLMRLLASTADRLKLSTACPKCGVPASRDAPAQYCDQCQSIFLKGIAVEPILRLEKESEVRSYQRRRRWTERLLSPIAGAGQIFADRPMDGAVLLFGFLLVLANLRWPDGLIVHPWAMGPETASGSLQLMIYAGIALVLLLISIRQSFR